MTVNPDLPERKPPPSVVERDWFKRFPTGGTVYVQPPIVGSDVAKNWFRRAPNGGTAYKRDSDEEGNE